MESLRIDYDYYVFVAGLLAKILSWYVLEPVLYPKSAFKLTVYYF